MLIFLITGFLTFISGILLLRRENRMFKNSIKTKAKVVDYYEYYNNDGDTHHIKMYTMAVEYYLQDGKLIHASEQKGSSDKKYPIGTEIDIVYSSEKNEMFNVLGDQSRKIVMIGMIIVGLAMVILSMFIEH